MSRADRERYRLLDHTADLKVVIFGSSLEELFANTAFMLFDVTLDINSVSETDARPVAITSADTSELLLDWIRELLFLFSTQGYVTRRADVSMPGPDRLTATLHGSPYDPARHGLKLEIKTPTYHGFRLEKNAGNWQAMILFDV